jgi:hypothetical protein
MRYKFRRQVGIEPCIVDFACLEAGLIIEADGGPHRDQVACDTRRTVQLEGMGYRVMRFWNHEVPGELQHVLEHIRAALIEVPSPHPSPGGEGVARYCQATSFPEEPKIDNTSVRPAQRDPTASPPHPDGSNGCASGIRTRHCPGPVRGGPLRAPSVTRQPLRGRRDCARWSCVWTQACGRDE